MDRVVIAGTDETREEYEARLYESLVASGNAPSVARRLARQWAADQDVLERLPLK